MKPLLPFSAPPFDLSIEATATLEHSTLVLEYVLKGKIDEILWPPPSSSSRQNDLWRHTCFEAFLISDGPGYVEFNISPSGEWNAYRFSAYRKDLKEEPQGIAPEITVTREAGCSRIRVRLTLPFAEGTSLRAGLTCVIEDQRKSVTYWALAHAGKRPDFHLAESFLHDV